MTRNILLICVCLVAITGWALWTNYRIRGLEIRMNLQEASQHWQEEPPK